MRYWPRSSLLPTRMGFVLHVINKYSSLYILTSSFVNMDTLPSLAVLPTLIRDVGNYLNVYASPAFLESCGNGSLVT